MFFTVFPCGDQNFLLCRRTSKVLGVSNRRPSPDSKKPLDSKTDSFSPTYNIYGEAKSVHFWLFSSLFPHFRPTLGKRGEVVWLSGYCSLCPPCLVTHKKVKCSRSAVRPPCCPGRPARAGGPNFYTNFRGCKFEHRILGGL